MRLFVAICLPPEAKAALSRGSGVLKQQGSGSFTSCDNMHLTLAFIGETPRWKEAVQAIQTVRAPVFTLTILGSGKFGPQLIWAGADLTKELTYLQIQVVSCLEQAGFSLEKKAFRPHLTLCRRFKPRGNWDKSALDIALGSTAFQVSEIVLMRSDRIRGKLTYTPVAVQPLTDLNKEERP